MNIQKYLRIGCCILALSGCKDKNTKPQKSASASARINMQTLEERERLIDSLSKVKTSFFANDWDTSIEKAEFCLEYFNSHEPEKNKGVITELKQVLVYSRFTRNLNREYGFMKEPTDPNDKDLAIKLAKEIYEEDPNFAKAHELLYELSGQRPHLIGFWAGDSCGSWMGTTDKESSITKYINKEPPKIRAKRWINSEPNSQDLEKKVVLLEFLGKNLLYYKKLENNVCVTTPYIKSQYLWEHRKNSLIVIGIYNKKSSDINDIDEFARRNKLTFPIAEDTNETFKDYGIKNVPQHWLIINNKVARNVTINDLFEE